MRFKSVVLMALLFFFFMIGKSLSDCFDDVLPNNTDEIKKKCPELHEQIMICLPRIMDCLDENKSRICSHEFYNCAKKSATSLNICVEYLNNNIEHIESCTNSIFMKLQNETIGIAFHSLKAVLMEVDGNHSSIATESVDSLDELLNFITQFTNYTKANTNFLLRQRIIKTDQHWRTPLKAPLKFWHGGVGNNILSRLIDRTLVDILWDSVNMKHVNHAWAIFADCVETMESGNRLLCLNNLISNLKEMCAKNSDKLQCKVYISLIEKQLNATFDTALSNEKIFKVISEFKLNDSWTSEYVIRENKLPLFHVKYTRIYDACYSVKRTVSSCLLIFHYCEQKSDPKAKCMDELHFCFSNITSAQPKCVASFHKNDETTFVSKVLDFIKSKIFSVLWDISLLLIHACGQQGIKNGFARLCNCLKEKWTQARDYWRRRNLVKSDGAGSESIPLDRKDVKPKNCKQEKKGRTEEMISMNHDSLPPEIKKAPPNNQ